MNGILSKMDKNDETQRREVDCGCHLMCQSWNTLSMAYDHEEDKYLVIIVFLLIL